MGRRHVSESPPQLVVNRVFPVRSVGTAKLVVTESDVSFHNMVVTGRVQARPLPTCTSTVTQSCFHARITDVTLTSPLKYLHAFFNLFQLPRVRFAIFVHYLFRGVLHVRPVQTHVGQRRRQAPELRLRGLLLVHPSGG